MALTHDACLICFDSFRLAPHFGTVHSTNCGHRFCIGCWRKFMLADNLDRTRCPYCKVALSAAPRALDVEVDNIETQPIQNDNRIDENSAHELLAEQAELASDLPSSNEYSEGSLTLKLEISPAK